MSDLEKAARQALEALEYLATQIKPDYEHNKAITSLRQALANEALDKMAENAMELGLDYTLTQTNTGIGERAMEAYEAAKQREWSGMSDERLMKMPDEPVAKDNSNYRLDPPFVDPLYTRPQPAAPAIPEGWKRVMPGGKHADQWDSARVADYCQGWNEYRKAAHAALEKITEQSGVQEGKRQAAQWLRNNYQDYPNIASLCDAMLAAAPDQPTAQWVGLTDEERFGFVKAVHRRGGNTADCVIAIEAKLREKNT